MSATRLRHGHARNGAMTAEYRIWLGMHQRCSNPRVKGYKHYGARGIRVCPRWFVFESFLADMGYRPVDMSIERRDNNGNYEPDNCHWATAVEQAQNRRSVHKFVWRGEEYTSSQFAKVIGLPAKATRNRLRRANWDAEKVFAIASLSQQDQWKLRSRKSAGKRVDRCLRGHEYTPENTYVDRKGYRNCRACRRLKTANGVIAA